ncbi:hypothetical protein B0H14DRAFT_2587349 [Mycena olivaceomarginata]|nr:hypothetical protein B0H14DRAFT_2587349 [Mycena olivaceomarginata]
MSLSKIIGCVQSGSGISGWNARLCPLSLLCARACGSLLDLYLWLELESGSTLKSTLSYISATSVIGNPTSNTETRSRNPEAVIILGLCPEPIPTVNQTQARLHLGFGVTINLRDGWYGVEKMTHEDGDRSLALK